MVKPITFNGLTSTGHCPRQRLLRDPDLATMVFAPYGLRATVQVQCPTCRAQTTAERQFSTNGRPVTAWRVAEHYPPAAGWKAGDEFTHKRMLDPWWEPAPGEKYAHGPHARMVITKVTSTWVYYGYVHTAESIGTYKTARDQFERDYPTTEEQP